MHRLLFLLLLSTLVGPTSARQRAWDAPHGPVAPALHAAIAEHAEWAAAFAAQPDAFSRTAVSGQFQYAATERGFARSLDGGRSWSLVEIDSDSPRVHVVLAAGSMVWTGTSKGVYRSLDAGRTWSPAALGMNPGSAVLLFRTSTGTLFAATHHDAQGCDLYRTRSDGQLWTCVDPSPVHSAVEAVIEEESRRISVTTGNGTYSSPDEGNRWVPVGIGAMQIVALGF